MVARDELGECGLIAQDRRSYQVAALDPHRVHHDIEMRRGGSLIQGRAAGQPPMVERAGPATRICG